MLNGTLRNRTMIEKIYGYEKAARSLKNTGR